MIKPANRRKSRMLALQGMYQYQFTKDTADVLIAQFLQEANPKKVDTEYFSDLLRGVISNLTAIDETLATVLDRSIEQVNSVELAILRVSVYELIYKLDVPYKVIINEALELAKKFGSEDGHKYVNGILDNLARKLRKGGARE